MALSVLVSVYYNDNSYYLDQALQSVWDDQYVKPNEIVLVKDGLLTSDLELVISKWESRLGDFFHVITLPFNVGLGVALNEGLRRCRYELVARMDADDISLPHRFQRQITFMQEHLEIAVSSAWIDEVSEDMSCVLSTRRIPERHLDIEKFAKRRNPISHPVTIFRKDLVVDVGGYPPFRKSQDYALWSLMLKQGYKMANLQEVLLKMRSGQQLFKRRGILYFVKEYQILQYQKKIGFLRWGDFFINLIIRSVVRLAPSPLKKLFYKVMR